MMTSAKMTYNFNPRPPRGGRLYLMAALLSSLGISIHAPREGGDGYQYEDLRLVVISIHAPREGGDGGNFMKSSRTWISIHAPREGGDLQTARRTRYGLYFNPRPPRGGRRPRPEALPVIQPISIHAPREGGDRTADKQNAHSQQISIHAPREGGDSKDAQFYL